MDKVFTKQEMIHIVFDSMKNNDFSMFEKIISENIILDFPGAGRLEHSRKVLIFLKVLMRKYAELIFNVSEIIIDNGKACAVWTNKGEHSNGDPYSNRGITLFYFSENKITFISDYFKDTSFIHNS